MHDAENYADQEGWITASVPNTLRDQHNSSHHTKAEFNNCFLFIRNIFKLLEGHGFRYSS